MRKKSKRLPALCLTAMLICLLPVNTMMAEEEPAAGASEESEGAPEDQEESRISLFAEAGAPEIKIILEGTDYAQTLGGADTIDYVKYLNNHDQKIRISTDQGDLYYYLDQSGPATSLTAAQLDDSALWHNASLQSFEIPIDRDGKYVLYVKVTGGDGTAHYARTGGLAADTVRPVIVGVQDGGTYPVGTSFTVEEENLDTVKINEQIVTPAADGSYLAVTDGTSTSCVIRAKDKAEHETICSLTITGDAQGGGEDPKDDTNVISKSGTYHLLPDTAYQLGGGKWKVKGDGTVYQGKRTFYVAAEGDYDFTRN